MKRTKNVIIYVCVGLHFKNVSFVLCHSVKRDKLLMEAFNTLLFYVSLSMLMHMILYSFLDTHSRLREATV